MIYLLNRFGQTCNQWIAFASCIGKAHMLNQNFKYPLMDPDFLNVFQISMPADMSIHISNNKVLMYIVKLLQRIIKESKSNTIILHWSEAVDYNVLYTERNYILSIIDFHDSVKSKIDEWWEENTKTDIVLGVHVRRGDYRIFEDGKYYFSDEEYIRWIKDFLREMGKKTVKILLFSNEIIDVTKFKGFQVTYMKGSVAEDLYAMSKCDYLLGPPSSFTRCASYMGGNKRMVLTSRDCVCQNSSFFSCEQSEFYISHTDIK